MQHNKVAWRTGLLLDGTPAHNDEHYDDDHDHDYYHEDDHDREDDHGREDDHDQDREDVNNSDPAWLRIWLVANLIFATHEVTLRVAADLIRYSVHIFPNNAVLFHRETFYLTNK